MGSDRYRTRENTQRLLWTGLLELMTIVLERERRRNGSLVCTEYRSVHIGVWPGGGIGVTAPVVAWGASMTSGCRAYVFRGDPLEKLHSPRGFVPALRGRVSMMLVCGRGPPGDRRGHLLPVVPCARWGLAPSDALVLCSAVQCCAVPCSAVPRSCDSEP